MVPLPIWTRKALVGWATLCCRVIERVPASIPQAQGKCFRKPRTGIRAQLNVPAHHTLAHVSYHVTLFYFLCAQPCPAVSALVGWMIGFPRPTSPRLDR